MHTFPVVQDVNTGNAPVRDFGEPGSSFIQWKNTEVCMDVVCLCGSLFHVDGVFAYAVRCPHCRCVMRVGTQVAFAETPTHQVDYVVDGR